MPTMNELEGLYKEGKGNRNTTPLLKTTGWSVWSGETSGVNNAWRLDFFDGDGYMFGHTFQNNLRAFAVRSRSGG